MIASVADSLSAFVAEVPSRDLPSEVLTAARWHLADTIGVCIAGARPEEEGAAIARSLVDRWRTPDGVHVLGVDASLPPREAALVTGLLAQSLEMDDKHGPSLARPGSTVVPVVLAAGEAETVNVDTALASLAVGYEVMVRLGLVAGDAFLRRGYHTSSLLAGFGAVATLGALRNCPADWVSNAFGIVGTFASGIQESTRTGSTAKIVHGGWGAHAGIIAADLADAGMTGPPSVFEGQYGLFKTHLGSSAQTNWDRATQDLGRRWHMTETAFKPYPCCQLLHSFIDASLQLRKELAEDGLVADDVEAIECRLAEPGLQLVSQPRDRKLAPSTPHEARFSLPYVVAHALVNGQIDVESFAPARLTDSAVLGIAALVQTGEDPLSDYPLHNPADITLSAGGRTYSKRVDYHPGCPEAPFAVEDVLDKFERNTTWRLSDGHAVGRRIIELPRKEPLAAVHDLLAEAKGPEHG